MFLVVKIQYNPVNGVKSASLVRLHLRIALHNMALLMQLSKNKRLVKTDGWMSVQIMNRIRAILSPQAFFFWLSQQPGNNVSHLTLQVMLSGIKLVGHSRPLKEGNTVVLSSSE